MDTNVHKQAISNITGMPVGEREGIWVVRDGETWREITTDEAASVVVEYDRLQKVISVPQKLTPQQLHRGLYNDGLYDQAVTVVNGNFEHKLFFEKSLEFQRNHPLLIAIAKDGFGMSDEQIDQKFIEWGAL